LPPAVVFGFHIITSSLFKNFIKLGRSSLVSREVVLGDTVFSRGLLHKFLSGQVLCHDEFTTCCILNVKPIYSTLYHGDILTLTATGFG